jgi:RNase P subunit RPR2
MSGDRLSTVLDAQVVACPKCNAQLKFGRSETPRIDDCGFECYSFECEKCSAALGGIIDPYDETLLLAVRAA